MACTVSNTFTCFLQLPLELQKMVWESAAANLSALDIQRFTAEITLTQPNADSNGWPRPLLCFTPHADFINVTSGHRSLLRACRESRQAAQKQIHCLLPIHYLTTDATGSLVTRQASVPFDPSGHFCISGLGDAILDASEGRGARGSKLLDSHSAEYIISQIQDLEQATSPIKNLTIVLGRALNNFPSRKYMLGWDDKVFDLIAFRMPNLKTASLTSEGVLDRRHHLDQQEFNKMHPSVAVFPVGERWWEQRAVPWYTLWANWRYERDIFIYIAHIKIIEMKRRQSAKPFVPGLVDSAADAAKERQLELSLSAVSE